MLAIHPFSRSFVDLIRFITYGSPPSYHADFHACLISAFHSTILHADVPEDYDEFPAGWYEGLEIVSLLTRSEREYAPAFNQYGASTDNSPKNTT